MLPVIVIMVLIFVHSSMSGDASALENDMLSRIMRIPLTDTAVIVVRKCAHLVEYMVLGVSMCFAVEDGAQARQDQNQSAESRKVA
jgi:hypothetical protein